MKCHPLDEFYRLFVVDRVKVTTYVRIEYPAYVSAIGRFNLGSWGSFHNSSARFPSMYLLSACRSSRSLHKYPHSSSRFRICEVCVARTGSEARMGCRQARQSLVAASRAEEGPAQYQFGLLFSRALSLQRYAAGWLAIVANRRVAFSMLICPDDLTTRKDVRT